MELISREDAIRVIALERLPENSLNLCVKAYNDATDRIQEVISQMDAIESRPKGNFEYLGESKRATYVDMYKCSNCDFVSLSLGDDFLNYCPHCGADMRGEE